MNAEKFFVIAAISLTILFLFFVTSVNVALDGIINNEELLEGWLK